jgi:hypothetical protein
LAPDCRGHRVMLASLRGSLAALENDRTVVQNGRFK